MAGQHSHDVNTMIEMKINTKSEKQCTVNFFVTKQYIRLYQMTNIPGSVNPLQRGQLEYNLCFAPADLNWDHWLRNQM